VLTADLVNARRRGTELQLAPLDPPARARVEELAAIYLEIARAHLGRAREELEANWRAVELPPRERRLGDGVLKLVSDRCVFEPPAEIDPSALRAEVFLRASVARRGLDDGASFDRGAILTEVAAARGIDAGEVERLLYSDLRGAERLCSVKPIRPARLAAGFDLAQMQALLLRATRVVAEVSSADPAAYRRLFHKLKFLRLLHGITALDRAAGGYRVEIDGPFSLFQAVTRYGLQLALALPAIAECGRWRIEAEVLWGKDRQPVTFRAQSAAPRAPAETRSRGAPEIEPPPGIESHSAARSVGSKLGPEPELEAEDEPARAPAPPDEIASLLKRLAAQPGPWRASRATAILDLPGAGVCVPDLVFRRRAGAGQPAAEVYLEVLGFWSREAVWRRVELVERGLPHRILFAVSKHLRVSEAALSDDLPGTLYVYARTLDPRAILERVERLAAKKLP
jgi:predicted nuclease of restriction endonuclease-like RecB superfamily